MIIIFIMMNMVLICLLYTSDAADERSSVDLGGRRIIKKKQYNDDCSLRSKYTQYQNNTLFKLMHPMINGTSTTRS